MWASSAALILISSVPLLCAAFPHNQPSQGAPATCGETEQLLKSQRSRIQADAGMMVTLLQSQYACNQRNEARRLAAALSEHSDDSSWWEAIFRGGQIASAVGDFETAEKLFTTIQKSNQAIVFFELGNVQLQAGKFGQAKESYERAAPLDPSSPDIQLGLAGARTLSGDGEQALSGLERAMQRFPNDSRFLIAYADVLQQLPEYTDPVYRKRAKAYMERAIAADSASAQAHYLLGQLLIADSNFSDAIHELETAIKYEPSLTQAHFALSRAYRRVGRLAEADEQFTLFEKLSVPQGAMPGTTAP